MSSVLIDAINEASRSWQWPESFKKITFAKNSIEFRSRFKNRFLWRFFLYLIYCLRIKIICSILLSGLLHFKQPILLQTIWRPTSTWPRAWRCCKTPPETRSSFRFFRKLPNSRSRTPPSSPCCPKSRCRHPPSVSRFFHRSTIFQNFSSIFFWQSRVSPEELDMNPWPVAFQLPRPIMSHLSFD